MNGLQLGVAQFQSSGGIRWEHGLLLGAQAAAIRLVFPCANDIKFHNDLFLSLFFLPMLLTKVRMSWTPSPSLDVRTGFPCSNATLISGCSRCRWRRGCLRCPR